MTEHTRRRAAHARKKKKKEKRKTPVPVILSVVIYIGNDNRHKGTAVMRNESGCAAGGEVR